MEKEQFFSFTDIECESNIEILILKLLLEVKLRLIILMVQFSSKIRQKCLLKIFLTHSLKKKVQQNSANLFAIIQLKQTFVRRQNDD